MKKFSFPMGVFAVLLASFYAASASDFVWTGGGDGVTWDQEANWDLGTGYPNGNADTATFIGGINDVTVPGGLTLGALTLAATFERTITLDGDLTLDSANGESGVLIVDGGTLVTAKDKQSNITASGAVNVGVGGTVGVRRSSTTGEGLGQTITADSMTIKGVVHADGEGFNPVSGPGAGGMPSSKAGTHAGIGCISEKSPYGSFQNPTSLGSGGAQLAGGGAIILVINGELNITGRLSANSDPSAGKGGGAGGSVNITANRLTGDGQILASSVSPSQIGGSGGRISIYNVQDIQFSGLMAVNGRWNEGGDMRGTTGTIAFPEDYELVLGGVGNMSTLRLGRDQANDYYFKTIVIHDGGTLELDGNIRLNDGLAGPAVVHAETITVHEGGVISSDELGFIRGTGYQAGAGGTYGGRGSANTKATYGSATYPLVFGSGSYQNNEMGGGAIYLLATEAIGVDGTITSSGSNGALNRPSGGSILLETPLLTGSGTICANGGTSTSTGDRGGGGGRISFVEVVDNQFAGTVEARGGRSTTRRASDGTIAFPEGYDLTIGGEGNLQSLTLGSDDSYTNVFGNIVIKDGGVLAVDGNPILNDYFGGAGVVEATSINIHEGGTLSAKGLGFTMGTAAPAIRDNTANNVGGAYGGAGAGDPLTYGSIKEPVNLGSGGAQLAGGGALTLKIADTLTVDGALDASGDDATIAANYGAGSGGTIWVATDVLAGSGSILANGGEGKRNGGGGGRIALYYDTRTFDGTISANGGEGHVSSYEGPGAAGTIYIERHGEKTLLVSNDTVRAEAETYTWIPAATNAIPSELEDVVITVAGDARIALSDSLTIGDLYLTGPIVSLFLKGHTLTVDVMIHSLWGNHSLVDYDDGQIVWRKSGTRIILR